MKWLPRLDQQLNSKEPEMQSTSERFVTTDEAAEYLHKPTSWLHNNAGRLRIPRYKVGNQWRYRLSEIAEWVERGAQRTAV